MAGQTVRGTGDKKPLRESRGKKRVGKGEIQAVCPVDPPCVILALTDLVHPQDNITQS